MFRPRRRPLRPRRQLRYSPARSQACAPVFYRFSRSRKTGCHVSRCYNTRRRSRPGRRWLRRCAGRTVRGAMGSAPCSRPSNPLPRARRNAYTSRQCQKGRRRAWRQEPVRQTRGREAFLDQPPSRSPRLFQNQVLQARSILQPYTFSFLL